MQKPYKDSLGILSIGVGRNLQDKGLSKIEVMDLLDNDIDDATEDAQFLVSSFDSLDSLRQYVIIDMAFNMGRTRLGKFRRMIAAVNIGDFGKAADEMVDSKWYRQVGIRAVSLERIMRGGE